MVETAGDRRLDVPIWRDGRQGRVRQGGAGRGARRAGRPRRALGQGPAVDHRARASCSPRCPSGRRPRRAGRRDARPTCRPARTVATGSVRRRAQLAELRPDLTFAGLRGNIATRLAKARRVDAIVVAAVAARTARAGPSRITEVLEPSVMLPQVGAGRAGGRVPRCDDATTAARCSPRSSTRPAGARVDAERGFLAELGRRLRPAGRRARHAPARRRAPPRRRCSRRSTARVVLRHRVDEEPGEAGPDPSALGRDAARHLLDRAGGRALLDR